MAKKNDFVINLGEETEEESSKVEEINNEKVEKIDETEVEKNEGSDLGDYSIEEENSSKEESSGDFGEDEFEDNGNDVMPSIKVDTSKDFSDAQNNKKDKEKDGGKKEDIKEKFNEIKETGIKVDKEVNLDKDSENFEILKDVKKKSKKKKNMINFSVLVLFLGIFSYVGYFFMGDSFYNADIISKFLGTGNQSTGSDNKEITYTGSGGNNQDMEEDFNGTTGENDEEIEEESMTGRDNKEITYTGSGGNNQDMEEDFNGITGENDEEREEELMTGGDNKEITYTGSGGNNQDMEEKKGMDKYTKSFNKLGISVTENKYVLPLDMKKRLQLSGRFVSKGGELYLAKLLRYYGENELAKNIVDTYKKSNSQNKNLKKTSSFDCLGKMNLINKESKDLYFQTEDVNFKVKGYEGWKFPAWSYKKSQEIISNIKNGKRYSEKECKEKLSKINNYLNVLKDFLRE